ncbi:MAG: ChrR family anti-sigma-E factor [Nitrococcus sp.]|nr:ChrR family anti-sigma-E factor [Nitrococcus sp.]
MTVNHHPSNETLLHFAAGTLSAGPAVVIAAHLEQCELCRLRVVDFESIGGMVLDDMPPTRLATDAFARTLKRLDETTASSTEGPIIAERHAAVGIPLPAVLRHCRVGRWRWLGPGFRWSKVTIPESPDAKVMLLKARAGLRLPAHGHTGMEYMQILSGSLHDDRGQYGPGDLDEADVNVEHQPVVDTQSECVCLAALEGDTRLHGLLGRLLWPVVGF